MADNKENKIEDYKKLLLKMFGKDSDVLVDDPEKIHIEKFSTGSYLLDRDLKGGYPKGTLIELFGGNSSGKAQPLNSKILTPSGWINMCDVKEGSVICTPDGKTSAVLSIHPQGIQDVYEVTFDDLTKTRCTGDHLWYVEKKTARKNKGEIMSLDEIVHSGLTNGVKKSVYKYRVPLNEPVYFNEQELPIDPYLLGVLLGDGCLQKSSVTFTTVDEFILNKITNIVERDFDLHVKPVTMNADTISYRISNNIKGYGSVGSVNNQLLDKLRSINCADKRSYEKEIPEIYIYNSLEKRIAILQGLMDSDGCIGKLGTASFSSTSKRMAEQVVELFRSIGFRATLANKQTQYRKQDGTKVDGRESYNVNICISDASIQCVTLPRKVDRLREVHSGYRYRYIIGVEKVSREECQCIYISHPDHLYITDDYIPTHNTTSAIHAVAEHQKKYPNETVLWVDLEKVFDPVYFKNIGININSEKFILVRPTAGEDAWETIITFAKTFENGVIVLDSVALLLPKKEDEGMVGDAQMGSAARMNSQGLRKLFPYMKPGGTTVFAINQTRKNIGGYGDPNVTTGGEAWAFYARTRLKTSVSKGEAGEYAIHKFAQIKANYGKRDTVTETTIVYGEGFNRIKELLEVAVEQNIINKSGSWYNYGDVKLGQGTDNVVNLLKDNLELMMEVETKIVFND